MQITVPAETWKNERRVALIPESVKKKEPMELKSVELLAINPSRSIDEIAGLHADELPRALKIALGGSGNTSHSGSGILSYLLFSHGFCKDLIELGFKDAIQRSDEIRNFFSDHFTGDA